MKKRTISILASVAVCISGIAGLTGCGDNSKTTQVQEKQNKSGTEEQADTQNGSSKPDGESAAEVSISLAHNLASGGTEDQAVQYFKEKVAELSDGKIEIVVYGNGQLGNERDMIEGVQLGTVDMALNTSAYLSNLTEQFGMLDLPFLYKDYDDAKSKLDGKPGEELRELMLDEQNIRVMSYWCSGFRVMLTKSAPINSLSDLKGRDMRAPEVDVYVDMFKALGANPTPIPFGEVYTSMQTGVVDGVEVCAEEMYTMKFHEVGKYIAVTNHIFSTMIPIINEDVFQELTSEQQDILTEAMLDAENWEWEHFESANQEALEKMEESGIEVTYPDQEELKKACASMQDEYAEKIAAHDLLVELSK